MSKHSLRRIWALLLGRWIFISLASLWVSWLYNNDTPQWHGHVIWVARSMMVIFWLTQVLHILFLVLLAGMVIASKGHQHNGDQETT